MIKIFFSILFLAFVTTAISQTKALTENGRQVVLYDNGTWQYTDSAGSTTEGMDSVAINPTPFFKSPGATFLVRSNVLNVGVYMDPSKWTFSPKKDNDMNLEYRFELKTQNGYAMMVTEKTPIDLNNLRQIALMNAQKAAYDARIVHSEYRTVNNQKILNLEMRGTIKGIKFVYFGYYFSNANGTVQLISFSTQDMFKDSKKDLETFLNGLVETKS